MGLKTLQMRAAALRAKRTAIVNGGGNAVFEYWGNKTQDINLFVKRGNRKYPFVGFDIINNFENVKPQKVSFVPSYNQILLFLAELNNWQPDGYDKDFWLEVASKALGALSREEEKYEIMFKIIEGELGEEIEGGVQRLGAPSLHKKDRHIGPVHTGVHRHRHSVSCEPNFGKPIICLKQFRSVVKKESGGISRRMNRWCSQDRAKRIASYVVRITLQVRQAVVRQKKGLDLLSMKSIAVDHGFESHHIMQGVNPCLSIILVP